MIADLLGATGARAQISASISGVVTDQTGAAVADAAIAVEHLQTGVLRTTNSVGAGEYVVPSLPVGKYMVRAKKQGFAEEGRTGIQLVVGQNAKVDLTLPLSKVTQQVNVTADAPMVSTTAADISGLVGEQQVKDLPLNGRSYDLLLPLNPGKVNFTSQKTGGTGISNSTPANNFAVTGNRPQQNLFLLNGVEFTGAAENNMQPGGPSGLLLGVEAVREFNVLRDNYRVEYGKRPAGQVMIVTEGGTNQWHGSGYEFLRNTLTGPGLATWDFSVFKDTSIRERLTLPFRTEILNILNRANFNTPSLIVFSLTTVAKPSGLSGTAGAIPSTSTTARQVQFGLKLLWSFDRASKLKSRPREQADRNCRPLETQRIESQSLALLNANDVEQDQCERTNPHDDPQCEPLEKWTDTDLLQCFFVESRSD